VTLLPESLAAYEVMALPTLTDDQLRAIVTLHRLEVDGPIARLESSGVVHSLWTIGSRWVLRVPKNEAMCVGDHRCESVAIPLALRAGVRTPSLVVFDKSLSLLDVPYSVVSRVHGRNLVGEPSEHAAYEDVGRELARLHTADLRALDHRWLREIGEGPAEDYFQRVVGAGLLHADGIRWLTSLCERLDRTIERDSNPPSVFVHGDVKPDNVMIDPSSTVHLIDWGDAGFGDPAYDFQSLPMRSIARVLAGYRSVRGDDDPTLEARIVRRVVARSVSNLARAPLTGPSWYRPAAANITDMLTFAIDHPDTWARWTEG
jgi:aminoglycoside phosphotransferase (APT) family kinase protein